MADDMAGGGAWVYPLYIFISVLDGYHELTGLPWWAIISIFTIALTSTLLHVLILQLVKCQEIVSFFPNFMISDRNSMKSTLKAMSGRGSFIFGQNIKLTKLAQSGRIDEAIKVFNSMTNRNTVTYNSMISAYAKNGRISEARQLFDQMPLKNLVSWNVMIAGYSHNDCIDEAAKLFDRMFKRDAFSWTIMISCYTRNGELDKARRLFDQMPEEKSMACYNAMISGYAKNRRFQEAMKLLKSMTQQDLVSWNSVLAGYTQNGEMLKASEFFKEMPERDVISWNLLLEGFARVGDLDSAVELFRRIPCPNVVSWVTMLNGYCKSGQIDEARRIFYQMPEKNVVSWNAMIAGYVQHLLIDEAYHLFTEMPERNSVSWTAMINGFVRSGKLDKARDLLVNMPFQNVTAQTSMINGYVQNFRMDDACKIFEQIRTPDVVCWNTMISGYAQCRRMDKAMELFNRMPKKDVVTWNTLISGYAQDGQMDKAVKVFQLMTRKSLVSWNSVISGFVQNGYYVEALQHFVLMKKEGMVPDWSTFACALSACASLAALQVGIQFHHLLLKSGQFNDLYAGNALINMYARCGRISRARRVFNEMLVVDLISWNTLIAGYALNGHAEEAISLFCQMGENAVRPDAITFVGILSACSHAGMVDKGLQFFHSMGRDYSIKPVTEHFACVTDLLGRVGRLEEAFRLIKQMPVEATAGIWGALLGACRIHKNLKLARIGLESLIKLEPHKTSNYVLLSNIHAEDGRWNEVERVRVLMKERGVQKQIGCSWIEIKNKVCTFYSHDSTMLTEELCQVLDMLNVQMRNTELKNESLLDFG